MSHRIFVLRNDSRGSRRSLFSVSGSSTRVSQLDLIPGRVQRRATRRERILSLCYLLRARGWAISLMRSSLPSPSSAPDSQQACKQRRRVRAISGA